MTEKADSPLVKRTILTFVSNLLSQAAKFILSFLLGPVIIKGLGKELYGVWGMVGQLVGYFSLTDLRPAGTMKFLLSLKQHSNDIDEKKRLIGTTLFLWMASLPFMALIGFLVVRFFPDFIKTDSQLDSIRVVLVILIVGVILDRLLSIPSNVLRAQNLEYKGMGISAITVLLVGFLNAFVVWQGWGLVGLAVSTLVGIVLSNAVRMWVALRAIPWIGMLWPQREEIKTFLRTSIWLTFSAISNLLLTSTDVLLIGIFLEPAASSTYLTTSLVLRSLTDPLSTFFSSANAGIAGLCGQGEWVRVEKLRREMYVIAIGIMTILGAGIISLNRIFLALWVGPEFFGGPQLNMLLILEFLLIVLVRIDTPIVSAALLIKEQAGVIFLGGVVSALFGILTMPILGVSGMALGIIVGQGILFTFNWSLLLRRLTIRTSDYMRDIGRPLLVGAILLYIANFLSTVISTSTWIGFIMWGVLVGSVTIMIVWVVGFSDQARQIVLARIIDATSRFWPVSPKINNK